MSTALLAGFLAFSTLGVGAPYGEKPEGFLAEPKSGHGPGVLVLHAWWGLNGDVKKFCRRLADSGFVAFAPDLFHGKVTEFPIEAKKLVQAHESKEAEIRKQISDAAKYLAERSGKSGIGVVGFSFGSYYALQFSNAEPERARAVVVYYGTGEEDFSKSKASYLGHFAQTDPYEPKASVDSLAKFLHAANRPAIIYTYPHTGHWFAEPNVTRAYNKAAADLAWKRTLKFLQQSLSASH
jgi:carboxymethylenebutenolidase